MARTKVETFKPVPAAVVEDAPVDVAPERVIPLVNPTPTDNFIVSDEPVPVRKQYRVTKGGAMAYKGMNLAYRDGQVITDHEDLVAIQAAGIKLQEI